MQYLIKLLYLPIFNPVYNMYAGLHQTLKGKDKMTILLSRQARSIFQYIDMSYMYMFLEALCRPA